MVVQLLTSRNSFNWKFLSKFQLEYIQLISIRLLLHSMTIPILIPQHWTSEIRCNIELLPLTITSPSPILHDDFITAFLLALQTISTSLWENVPLTISLMTPTNKNRLRSLHKSQNFCWKRLLWGYTVCGNSCSSSSQRFCEKFANVAKSW